MGACKVIDKTGGALYIDITMADKDRCPYCKEELKIIWVHGHGQCKWCKHNIEECCTGEICKQ